MARGSIGRASVVLGSGTLVSRILGFLMAIVSTNTIGVFGAGADSFAIANQLPNTIYGIIAGGTLNAVLVPQIVKSALHADGGTKYINRLVTLALTILGLTTIAAVVAAPILVPILTETNVQLATAFAYWCLPQIFFYGLYTILGEVLNARGSFGPFTWAPAINNVVVIIGLFVFAGMFGSDPKGLRPASTWSADSIALLGGSATLGIVLQALVLTLFWKRVGLKFSFDFRFRGVGLGEAGRMAGWTFAALMVTTIAGVIETRVASTASVDGNASVKALQTAWLIFMLPHSVITVSVATAYFTRMSEDASSGAFAALRKDVSSALRIVALMLTFAAVALIALSVPFAQIFSGTGSASVSLGLLVVAYSIALPAFSLLAVVQRTFYALGDAKTPFIYTIIQSIVVVVGSLFALLLPVEFVSAQIALATAVSIVIQAVIAALLLRRKMGGTGGSGVIGSLLLYVIAAVPTLIVGGGLTLLALATVLGDLSGSGPDVKFASILTMAVVGIVMATVYFGMLWFLKNPELRTFAAPIIRRFSR